MRAEAGELSSRKVQGGGISGSSGDGPAIAARHCHMHTHYMRLDYKSRGK